MELEAKPTDRSLCKINTRRYTKIHEDTLSQTLTTDRLSFTICPATNCHRNMENYLLERHAAVWNNRILVLKTSDSATGYLKF